jgi:hypothetical protein
MLPHRLMMHPMIHGSSVEEWPAWLVRSPAGCTLDGGSHELPVDEERLKTDAVESKLLSSVCKLIQEVAVLAMLLTLSSENRASACIVMVMAVAVDARKTLAEKRIDAKDKAIVGTDDSRGGGKDEDGRDGHSRSAWLVRVRVRVRV